MAENQVTISYKTIGLTDLKKAAELIAETGKHAETTGQAYDALGAAVLRTLKADKQLSTEMRKLNKDRQTGKIELEDYIRAEEELYRVRGETINRDKELIRIEGQREKARQKEAADLERLREKYDSEYAAQKKFDQSIIDINRSLGEGSVKAQKAIASVTNEYREFVRATKTGDVINAGNQFARFGDQAYRSQQRIKRFASVGLQQAGYQVGDFIVQIQSGQNALVALGQQGSQLAGIFGTGGAIAGAVLAGATAIGMIAWEAYKASNNIKTLEEAFSDLDETTQKLADAQENLRSKDLNETYGNFTSLIKEVSAAAEEANKKLGELNITALQNTLLNEKKVSVWRPAMFGGLSLSDYIDAGFDTDLAKSQDQAEKIAKDLGIGYGQVFHYLKQMSTATGGDLVRVGTEFINAIRESSDGFAKTNTEGLLFFDTLQRATEQTAEMLALYDGSAEAGAKANEALAERVDQLKKVEEAEEKAANYTNDTVTQLNNQVAVLELSLSSKKEIAALDRQLFMFAQAGKQLSIDELNAIMAAYDNLQKVTLVTKEKSTLLEKNLKLLKEAEEAEDSAAKYSKDTVTQLNNQAAVLATSIKSKTAIAALNRQQFMFAQAGKQLSIDELTAIMAAYDNLQKVTGETKAFTEEAKRTQDVLEKIDGVISSIRGNISSLETSVIGEAAKLAALKAGKSIEESRFAGQIAEKWAAFNASVPADIPDGAMSQREELFLQEIELMTKKNALAAEGKVIEDKIRDSKKKGKEDPAIKMLEEISRRKVLIGLTEEQAKRQELIYETEDKLGKFREKYGNDFINKIVNQTVALDEQQKVLDKAKEQQKEIGDMISSSMEDAFMSIVDGTKSVKDAFKSMAASVISELYRILVIKKIVAGITSFLPFADGGVFSGGSVVPSAKGNAFYGGNVIPFANGGVVSSPMTFPMTGGKTGLMGEAGPEAIMPLKRGKGGKLGVVAENNGNVVINQSFNFSANGDESVKKIIAQAAPQIAQMTKTSIINDRRRGGSTLAAFGR
jgi:hypothetical protein